jgi:predicted rRNA methylase YqxC with S4 and FtsJ domains
MKHGNLRNKLFSSNDGKVLNENVPALNSLGANWVEEIMKANEILDSLGSEKLRTKEKRVSMTRDSSMLDIGVSTSGFSSSSSINNIVSDSLTKLVILH